MKNKRNRLVAFALALMMLCVFGLPAATMEQAKAEGFDYSHVRVLLSLGSYTSKTLTVDGNYYVKEAPSVPISKQNYKISASNGSMSLADASGNVVVTGTSTITFVELAPASGTNNYISIVSVVGSTTIGTLNYTGDMKFYADGSTVRCINSVYLDDYVAGVVPYEMSDSWNIEALKAQAIFARTYAAKRMQANASRSYDVVDTISNQVYRGYKASYTNARRAANETAKQVLFCDGEMVSAYYAASNGGYVDIPQHVWSSSEKLEPYEVVKADPYDLEFSSSRTVEKLPIAKNGSIANATLAKYMKKQAIAALGLSNSYSDATITAVSSVTATGIRSGHDDKTFTKCANHPASSFEPLQDCANYTGYTAVINITVAGTAYNNVSIVLDATKLAYGGTYAAFAYSDTTLRLYRLESDNDNFYLVHCRWGHGVGMSQYGAYIMAKNHDKTYREIIDFYYPHTSIAEVYAKDTSGNSVLPVNVPVSGFAAKSTIRVVGVGRTTKLTYAISPSNATNKTITYRSSSATVATVSSSGTVTGKKPGRVMITATTADGGFKAYYYISVVKSTRVKTSVKKIVLSSQYKALQVGQTYAIKAGVLPKYASNRHLFYLSANPTIATVGSVKGIITAKSPGRTAIRVYSAQTKKYKNFYITVTDQPIVHMTKLTVSKTSLTVKRGKTSTIKAKLYPSNTTIKDLRWISGNQKVAKVSATGVVTGVKKGSTYIYVFSYDSGKYKKIKVTVR